jgi:hypothetical protein
VQFADSTTMKYSSMLNNKGINAASDSDDDVPMQQRVYDMPPSDSDQSDSDQSDNSDNEDSEEDNEDNEEDNRSSEDEDEAEAEAEVQVLHKSNAKKAMNKCEINVDDI